ncbi:MAG: cation transporter [Actinomycetota bacterium]|nr:cation transporter [Actinomycetota bacterium]
MTRRTFHVDNIHCEGCSTSIRDALGRLPGVEDVEADPQTNTVVVSFNESQADQDTIAERLARSGFPVTGPPATDEPDGPSHNAADDRGHRPPGWWSRYGLLVAAVVVVALAGYVGYELYPRFDLPALEGAGLLVLAAGAGIASFFAPCSFPLLVTLLSRQVGGTTRGRGGDSPVLFASALAGGATVFLVLLGALIALGGGAFAASVTFTSTVGITLRIVVGTALIFLGLVQLGVFAVSSFHAVEDLTKRFNRSQARLRREHPVAGFAAFGFFYLLAGFG